MCQKTLRTATCAVFSYNKVLPSNRCIWETPLPKLWMKAFLNSCWGLEGLGERAKQEYDIMVLRFAGMLEDCRCPALLVQTVLPSYGCIWGLKGFPFLNCEWRFLGGYRQHPDCLYWSYTLIPSHFFQSHMETTVRTLQGQYWRTGKAISSKMCYR